MKAITIIQPWATLIAIGAKHIETRSWSTNYRGPLAIHAGQNTKFIKRRSKDYILDQEPFYSIITKHSQQRSASWVDIATQIQCPVLPLGAIVATCRLTNCIMIQDHMFPAQVDDSIDIKFAQKFAVLPPPEPERSFGDYTPGRYAWILEDIKPLEKPYQINGSLGLWEWKNTSELNLPT